MHCEGKFEIAFDRDKHDTCLVSLPEKCSVPADFRVTYVPDYNQAAINVCDRCLMVVTPIHAIETVTRIHPHLAGAESTTEGT